MGKYVQAYQHVLRIGDAAIEGILTGKVYLFPKIDGHSWEKQLLYF